MTRWVLDRKVSMAFILALAIYAISAVWSYADLHSRTRSLEDKACAAAMAAEASEEADKEMLRQFNALNAKVGRLETDISWIRATLQEIKRERHDQ